MRGGGVSQFLFFLTRGEGVGPISDFWLTREAGLGGVWTRPPTVLADSICEQPLIPIMYLYDFVLDEIDSLQCNKIKLVRISISVKLFVVSSKFVCAKNGFSQLWHR